MNRKKPMEPNSAMETVSLIIAEMFIRHLLSIFVKLLKQISNGRLPFIHEFGRCHI